MKGITECGISDAKDFHLLWKLPGLPLTERLGRYDPDHRLDFDQELLISLPTGHVQLRNQLDQKVLYGGSDKSRRGVEFFPAYVRQFTARRSFKSTVDVGGNDLFVVRGLSATAKHCAVIDPICAPIDGQIIDGIKVFGRFAEVIDFTTDLPRPDLVEFLRFDAVFDQHFHYFDLNSFKHLIWECGGEYLGHTFNHQGSCGGALQVTFHCAQTRQPKPDADLAARIAGF